MSDLPYEEEWRIVDADEATLNARIEDGELEPASAEALRERDLLRERYRELVQREREDVERRGHATS